MKTRKNTRKASRTASASRRVHRAPARSARRGSPRRVPEPRQRSAPRPAAATAPTPGAVAGATLVTAPRVSPEFPKDDYDYRYLQDFMARDIAPRNCRAVVLGCAQGEASVLLSERGYRVTGLDSDRAAIGLARERAWLSGCDIDFMIGDLFEMANLLPAESFGLAVDRTFFQRIPSERDRRRYLESVLRLMLPSGIFVLGACRVERSRRARTAHRRPARRDQLLVQEGGEMVGEVLRSGFDVAGRHLYPFGDDGRADLMVYCRK